MPSTPGPRRALVIALLALLASRAVAEPQFQGYEIRVIRPRQFVKAGKIELGLGVSAIMNQSFIYSYLATGIVDWHLNEVLALEALVAYGQSFDRQEKRLLVDDFGIHTVLLRTQSLANARVVWTPSYGKYYLNSSRIVYFDTFVTVGGGLTGIDYRYDHCDDPHATPRAAAVHQYPTPVVGIGQRHFLDDSTSVRIGAEVQRVLADAADESCDAASPSAVKPHDNVILYLGWSLFL